MTMHITAVEFYNSLSHDNLTRIRDMTVENLEIMNDILDRRFDFMDTTDHPAIYHTNEGYVVMIDCKEGPEVLCVDETYEEALESAECFSLV